jgi:hypothetical protein
MQETSTLQLVRKDHGGSAASVDDHQPACLGGTTLTQRDQNDAKAHLRRR